MPIPKENYSFLIAQIIPILSQRPKSLDWLTRLLGYQTIYTNHRGGNSVHKHKTIEFDVLGGRPATNYIQIT